MLVALALLFAATLPAPAAHAEMAAAPTAQAVVLAAAAAAALPAAATHRSAARGARHARAARRVDRRCTPAGVRALRGTARAERRVRCLINRRRARSSAPPLRYNRCLDRAAERHARDMVRRRYFAHSSRGGGTPEQRARAAGYVPRAGNWTVAENLGWGRGRGAVPSAVFHAWMRSPGHRANILRARHRDIGVAVVAGAPVRDARGARAGRPAHAARRASATRSTPATYVVEFGARQQHGRCSTRR